VAGREIDEYHPQYEELQVAPEIEAPGERACDERRRDDGKHELVGEEEYEGHGARIVRAGGRAYLVQREMVADVANDAVHAGAEGKTEAAEYPDNGNDAHGDETLHHDSEHVLAPHEAAVEEGESRRHEADQSRTEQYEGGIASIGNRHGKLLSD
jgi:hypothetical protein